MYWGLSIALNLDVRPTPPTINIVGQRTCPSDPFSLILLNAYSGDDGYGIQPLHTWSQWCCALVLALFPTVISLVLMAVAVKHVGSTPTAVIGALEPVTAVVVGVTLFSEPLTMRLGIGIVLILLAVILIVMGKRG